MTDVILGLSPYEAYLDASAAPRLADQAATLADNLFGPKRDQDLFALMAALVAHGRTSSLELIYAGDTPLHAVIRDRVGSRHDRGFAGRAGAPFRSAEPAVSHAVRALAGLGLTLAHDHPRPEWLAAALAWHEEARCAPPMLVVPWSPAGLAGDDPRLRQRLESLAEVAGARWQEAHVVSVAMTLRCLAHPSVRPNAPALLYPGNGSVVVADSPAGRQSSRVARRLRSPGSKITVLFDQGQDGIKAQLQATTASRLPPCLIADPERMSLLAADAGFQDALRRAWQLAGQGLDAMVLWSIETAEGPQRYLTGESLGAAFAVIIDEVRRVRRPLASLLTVRRLVGRNAVVGKVDDLGYLQSVEGYDTKLTAFDQTGKVIIPQTDLLKATAASRLIEPKPELVPAGRWKQAARSARGSARRVLVRDAAILATVAAVVAAAIILVHQNAINGQQSRLAAASQFAAQSESLDTTDPVQAAMLAAAAWKLAPTPSARDSLLDVLAQPVRGVLHTGRSPVYGVDFSPNGALLASVEEDGAVQVWNVASHREAYRPFHLADSHNERAMAIFSPNGKFLAAAGTGTGNVDSVVQVRDVETGRVFARLSTGSDTEAVALAFSPNSQILAIATGYGQAYLFDLLIKKWVGRPMTDNSAIMTGLAFSPKGNILAIANLKGRVQLWNAATQQEIGSPLVVDTSPGWTTVAFSPNGDVLATGTAGVNSQISFWNVSTHRLIGTTLESSCAPNTETFSPDGQVLATACADGNTRLFDVDTEQEVTPPLAVDQTQAWTVAYSPDDSTVATGGADGTVTLWDADGFRQMGGYVNVKTPASDVAYSPNGTTIATADFNGALQLWSVASRQQVGSTMIADKQELWNAVFSPNGKLIATSSYDGSARIWSTATDRQIGPPMTTKGQTVYSVAFSPNGKLLASGGTDDYARLWSVATHREVGAPMNAGEVITHLTFSPNGRILAIGTYAGFDALWNLDTHRRIATLTAYGSLYGPLAFSPDGKVIATATEQGVVQLWNTMTGGEIGKPFETDDQLIIGMAFTDNGQILATGSQDGTVRLWDVDTDQEIGSPFTAPQAISSLAFNRSGKILAIAYGDYISLLDVALPANLSSAVCGIASGESLPASSWQAAGIPAEQVCAG
jgi:WD40 repeat protein